MVTMVTTVNMVTMVTIYSFSRIVFLGIRNIKKV